MVVGSVFKTDKDGNYIVDKNGDYIIDREATRKRRKEAFPEPSREEKERLLKVEKELRENERAMIQKQSK